MRAALFRLRGGHSLLRQTDPKYEQQQAVEPGAQPPQLNSRAHSLQTRAAVSSACDRVLEGRLHSAHSLQN